MNHVHGNTTYRLLSWIHATLDGTYEAHGAMQNDVNSIPSMLKPLGNRIHKRIENVWPLGPC
jgi:hypothetical protein